MAYIVFNRELEMWGVSIPEFNWPVAYFVIWSHAVDFVNMMGYAVDPSCR